jgi:predicted choloylglycine hydrolase
MAVRIEPPEIADQSALLIERREISKGLFAAGNSRYRQSESGLHELYLEGEPFERGVHKGKLTKALVQKQEEAFTDEIKKMIPSEGYLKFLKYMIAWFNRNIQDYIPDEYLHEIYGVSFAASDQFSYIGSNYERILNYHAAHDIGHALNDLAMVGCTSFSVRGSETPDGNMIIGRNFDFYVGDRFAEDKIVAFYKPSQGHGFVTVVWGGFTGVVSGMNDRGLTLTMNAAKSDIPLKAAAPVSLIAREILQYAETIEQAFEIAKKRRAFVSEAFMIGSQKDKRTAIIEITPKTVALFDPGTERVIGPNHFQSEALKDTESNLENIRESSSLYRYQRMHELLDENPTTDYLRAADILRNRFGKNGENIGMGNEKAINQLIAHHSIIFKPDELKFWVSTNPFQLGKYVCYDLDSVFARFPTMKENKEIYEEEFTIPTDSFLYNGGFERFELYKELKKAIQDYTKSSENSDFQQDIVETLIASNPEYFYAYELAGDYCVEYEHYKSAKTYYLQALKKEISTLPEKERIQNKIEDISGD